MAPTITVATEPPSAMPVTVTWKLTRHAAAVAIDYSVTNGTDAPILVLDVVVGTTAKGLTSLPDRFVTRYDEATQTLVLTAGYVPPQQAVAPGTGVGTASQTMPLGRIVAARASVSGTKVVALPISAWHPDISAGSLAPVPAQPRQAVVELGWVPVAGVTWEQNQAADGTMLKAPSAHFVSMHQVFARGAAQSLTVN